MSDDVVNRLRCRYASGPIINGEPEFGWRDFGGPAEKLILPTPIMKEAADEIERLRAEVAELREDAERYRWLRDECPWMMVSGNGKSNLSIRVRAEFDLGDLVDMVDEFDAAIDAARKGEA